MLSSESILLLLVVFAKMDSICDRRKSNKAQYNFYIDQQHNNKLKFGSNKFKQHHSIRTKTTSLMLNRDN